MSVKAVHKLMGRNAIGTEEVHTIDTLGNSIRLFALAAGAPGEQRFRAGRLGGLEARSCHVVVADGRVTGWGR